MGRYVIEDTHAQLLKLACCPPTALHQCADRSSRKGETVIGSTGQPAAHPLIAAEGAAQKRVAAFLKQLGLFDEAKRDKPGRPLAWNCKKV
jgi:hypothetical protein